MVVTQAGQHVQAAKTHVVLHVNTERVDFGIVEGIVGDQIGKRRCGRHVAIRIAGHPPGIETEGHEVLRMNQPVGLGIEAVGTEGDAVGDDVPAKFVGTAVN